MDALTPTTTTVGELTDADLGKHVHLSHWEGQLHLVDHSPGERTHIQVGTHHLFASPDTPLALSETETDDEH